MNRRSDPFDASASALGYLYQARYALLHAIRHSGGHMAGEILIEGLDDVEFTQDGTPSELIQLKHRIFRTADLSNASRDLWKALRVWMHRLDEGSIALHETAFVIVTTGSVTVGSAASFLGPTEGRDPERAASLLTDAAETSTSASNESAYKTFLSKSEAERRAFLAQVTAVPSGPSASEIRGEIEAALRWAVSRGHLEALVDRVEGWWFREIVKCLSSSQPQPIQVLTLEEKVRDVADQFGRENLPIDFHDLSIDSLSPEDERKAFVEQLRLINVGTERILHAVLDYYRAYRQRSRWLEDNLLVPGELGRYESRLVEEWSRYFAMLKEDLSPDAVEDEKVRIGRQLYRWAAHEFTLPIRPECTEPYVCRGSYQMLSDRRMVGWHPEFSSRLEELLEEAAG